MSSLSGLWKMKRALALLIFPFSLAFPVKSVKASVLSLERSSESPFKIEREGSNWRDEESFLLDETSRESGEGIEGSKENGSRAVNAIGEEELRELLKVRNGRVEFFIRYYQTRGARFFRKWLIRSGEYLSLVKGILREEGIPEDIAYLPLIESGFSPLAHSRAGAVGIWQFVEGTARRYGLRVDWWIDERRDVEKATRAAAAYLRDLYETFGSWFLALAAYNAGEGRVIKAVMRYKTSDPWYILNKRIFKRETRNYIPKFIAAVTIAKDPERYGFKDIRYKSPLLYDKIVLKDATDVKVVAEAAGVKVKDILRLNPQLKRWFTPPDYPDYELKIPKGRKEIFLRNFARIPPSKRLEFYRHKVRKGETLISIARRYHTTVKAIAYLNNITDPRRLRTGSHIVVPVRAKRQVSREVAERVVGGKKVVYTVKKGDTLWDIARYFGVNLTILYRLNGLKEGKYIYPGDRITIPVNP